MYPTLGRGHALTRRADQTASFTFPIRCLCEAAKHWAKVAACRIRAGIL